MQVIPNLSQPESVLSPSMRFTRLADWLAWQEELHFTSIELGLERCLTVAGRMGLLQPGYHVISVAGTNGKGSSAHMLRSILSHAGYAVGSYISPHLVRYNERICLNGMEATDEMICAAFDRVDRARGDISLTYFEFGTLAAFDIFQRAGIDVAVLEVGLGGRLDAVNCLDADAALITAIDLDHEKWLGWDRETIGREKAGIMRTGAVAVCSDPEPPRTLLEHAAALGVNLQLAGRDFYSHVTNRCWEWRSGGQTFSNLPRPSLYNVRQLENAAGVLMVLLALAERLPVPDAAIRRGLEEFNLNGRFQIVPDRAQLILDVAHNPQSMQLLASNLKGLPVAGSTHVIIGMLNDKNHPAIFKAIMDQVDCWHLVSLEGPRGTASDTLGEELAALDITGTIASYHSVAEAINHVRTLVGPQDRIVVTGSFLTVGAALRHLRVAR